MSDNSPYGDRKSFHREGRKVKKGLTKRVVKSLSDENVQKLALFHSKKNISIENEELSNGISKDLAAFAAFAVKFLKLRKVSDKIRS